MLKITLQLPNLMNAGEFKELYRQSVEITDVENIPFDSLIKNLRFLYPYDNLIINFQIT